MAPYTHFHNFSVHTHHRRPKGGRHYQAIRSRQRPWRLAFILAAVAYVGLQVLNPILLVPVAQSCAENASYDFLLESVSGGSGTAEEMIMKRCWWIVLPAAAASVTSPFSIWEWVRHSFGSADGPDESRTASGPPHQPDPWATNYFRNQRTRVEGRTWELSFDLPWPRNSGSSPRKEPVQTGPRALYKKAVVTKGPKSKGESGSERNSAGCSSGVSLTTTFRYSLFGTGLYVRGAKGTGAVPGRPIRRPGGLPGPYLAHTGGGARPRVRRHPGGVAQARRR